MYARHCRPSQRSGSRCSGSSAVASGAKWTPSGSPSSSEQSSGLDGKRSVVNSMAGSIMVVAAGARSWRSALSVRCARVASKGDVTLRGW
eukprot:3550094-Prymnesium_polylepis.1